MPFPTILYLHPLLTLKKIELIKTWLRYGQTIKGLSQALQMLIICNCTTVKEKDFGVTINIGMNVSEQCGIAASKGDQILGLIRRNITYKEKKLIIPLYKAIVRPHLAYGKQAWRQYCKNDIYALERIQRRATK